MLMQHSLPPAVSECRCCYLTECIQAWERGDRVSAEQVATGRSLRPSAWNGWRSAEGQFKFSVRLLEYWVHGKTFVGRPWISFQAYVLTVKLYRRVSDKYAESSFLFFLLRCLDKNLKSRHRSLSSKISDRSLANGDSGMTHSKWHVVPCQSSFNNIVKAWSNISRELLG